MSPSAPVTSWSTLAPLTLAFAKQASGFVADLREAGVPVPAAWWYDPVGGGVHPVAGEPPPGFGVRPWVPVKAAGDESATGPFGPFLQAAHVAPAGFSDVYGGPTPLAAMLAGGLLGAGGGYVGGRVLENLLGDRVVAPGRLRRTFATIGGGLGALPGAYLGTVNARLAAEDGRNPLAGLVEPNAWMGKRADAVLAAAAANFRPLPPEVEKAADAAGGFFVPSIPVDAFNRAIWQDPNTPPPIRAAAAGLVGSAAAVAGAQVVSPFDVARIGIGMGSGWVSGRAVGKVLGALAGLTPGAQDKLQQAGVWAGLLSNVVPRAFGM